MDFFRKLQKDQGLRANAEDVRHAYRLFLGREPDPAGLRYFLDLAHARKLTAPKLADLFVTSQEYHERQAAEGSLHPLDIERVRLFPRASDRLIGGSMRDHGDYESWVVPHFLAALRPGHCVLDVGANIGFFSMISSKAVGPSGLVLAIEPLERNLRSLYAAVDANGCTNVRVFAMAASDRQSIVRINCESDSSNGVIVDGAVAGERVQAGPLDQWLDGIHRLDIVKIDVEGHEPRALAGMNVLLERFKPTLFAEFGPHGVKNHSNVEADSFAKWFVDYGQVDVLLRSGATIRCGSATELLEVWSEQNERAGMNGLLHLDIRVEP